MQTWKKILIVAAVIVAIILAVFLSTDRNTSRKIYQTADELKGKTIAVISGAATGGMTEQYYDGDVELAYYNSNADMAAALQGGKVDAYMADIYACQLQCKNYPDHKILEDDPIRVNNIGFLFKKDNARSAALCDDMNTMIREFSESGKLKELEKKWSQEEKPEIDIELSGENGKLKYVCCTSIGKPFCFVQDGEIVGYEMEIAHEFCKRYGYDLEIIDSDYGGMLTSVAAGKADFGGTSTSITEERKKQCLFSDSTLAVKFNLVVMGAAAGSIWNDFFTKIADSFYATFIEEGRWKLYVSGIGTTLLVTVASILFGSALGLGVFLLCYDNKEKGRTIVDACIWLVHGMPAVVFLMLLYYIVFGRTSWSGVVISIIGFTIIFACAFIGMLINSYNAISYGQTEAAISLGYTPFQALWKRILPQMIIHFRRPYEAEIVSLLKATSIVGYIAVQDLTKVTDIIRGRTYQAFFPLISTTILYFMLAWILKIMIEAVFRHLDSRRRTESQILKGVERK